MIGFSPKFYFGLIVFSFTTLTIQLFPLSKQASSWNRCLRETIASLSQVNLTQNMDDQTKEVLSVMICNGAVFDTKFKTNDQ